MKPTGAATVALMRRLYPGTESHLLVAACPSIFYPRDHMVHSSRDLALGFRRLCSWIGDAKWVGLAGIRIKRTATRN
jgi:hypothetical protein